ncbi:MAG: NUDIX hydrolase [Acidimicrobiia bacterium]|nr:NUDIX hydrolase [Acidimicrobiia bacterium]
MPRASTDPGHVHAWTVAGGLVESTEGLLMVRNVRPGGETDWSPPGGVIDAADPSLPDGLTREVAEETGLTVTSWEGPVYRVIADALDMGWRMTCEVHYALEFEGAIDVADPDGIVVDARFMDAAGCAEVLVTCARWVREPLESWMKERWSTGDSREFHYEVRGTRLDDLAVHRRAP